MKSPSSSSRRKPAVRSVTCRAAGKAPTQTHYCVGRPGASLLLDVNIGKICEAPGAVWSPTAPAAAPNHAL